MPKLSERWRLCLIALAGTALVLNCAAQQHGNETASTETIVMIRHGEKPAAGLGQLNCKGLNRAMALPSVLIKRFGKPDYLFASDPADEVKDHGAMYSYVRPLATIEPTAVRAGLPVNTQIGYTQIAQLQRVLTQPEYANATVFVAWEHGYLNEFGRQFLRAYGENAAAVPDWPANDYDSMYVFKLTRRDGTEHLAFQLEHEGLNGSLSDACPAK